MSTTAATYRTEAGSDLSPWIVADSDVKRFFAVELLAQRADAAADRPNADVMYDGTVRTIERMTNGQVSAADLRIAVRRIQNAGGDAWRQVMDLIGFLDDGTY